MKKSVFAATLTVFAIITALILCGIFGFYVLPMKKEALKDNIFEKVNAISNLSEPVITKAVKTQDDVALLSQIEKIMRLSDISTVYVLDGTGKVVTHDKTGEWGKVYTDELTKNILSVKKPSLIKSTEARGWLYVTPLVSSATLCIGVSSDKIDTKYDLAKKHAFITALTIFVLSMFGMTLFLIIKVKLPFRILEQMLKALKDGTIDRVEPSGLSEFTNIINLINETAGKLTNMEINASSNQIMDKENYGLLIQEIAKTVNKGLIITNPENKVLFINDKIKTLLAIDTRDFTGRHILDVLDKPAYIDIIKKSTEQPGTEIIEKVEDKVLRVFTVANIKNELIGTIITAD